MAIRKLACIAGSAVIAVAGMATNVDLAAAAPTRTPTLKAEISPYTVAHTGVLLNSGITGTSYLVTTPQRSVIGARFSGLQPGHAYGVHVHNGTCADYAGHYKYDPTQTVATRANEVWLDVFANRAGRGGDHVVVRPINTSGPLSIVIHEESNPDAPANVSGAPQPGARESCGNYVARSGAG
ncbi:MAG: superoxide dismutase family protein [Actinomycetota bacterium]|nr:superoxide dismutase family protein [Actinomycetota bacterium]